MRKLYGSTTFLKLPIEKKRDLQDDCLRDMMTYYDEEDIEPTITQAMIDSFYGKVIEMEYLVGTIKDKFIIIDFNTLGEIYQLSNDENISAFLLESEEEKLNHSESFKADCIYHDNQENWYAFEKDIIAKYQQLIQKDKAYYGQDYS